MESLLVRSAQGDYQVHFRDSLSLVVQALLKEPPKVLVADARVVDLYREQLSPLLSAVPHLLLEATEENKTLAGVECCVRFLQSQGCNRTSTLLAIGGGIIQDICSFSAHIYYRGIRWSFLPTTLLSMCDSCIGAKCSINLGAFKNQLGAFQSPSSITICTDFLDTLADREIASGYGEMLKLMLTSSEASFDRMSSAVTQGGMRNPNLPALLREALNIKRKIIEADEYDLGLRQTLNYGHTFGHALEAVTEHAVPHGLAVAWGMDLVNHIAERRGLLAPRHRRVITDFIQKHLPGIEFRPLRADELLDGVKRDKKASVGTVTLAVLREPGRLERMPTPMDDRLRADLEDYLDHQDVFRKHLDQQ